LGGVFFHVVPFSQKKCSSPTTFFFGPTTPPSKKSISPPLPGAFSPPLTNKNFGSNFVGVHFWKVSKNSLFPRGGVSSGVLCPPRGLQKTTTCGGGGGGVGLGCFFLFSQYLQAWVFFFVPAPNAGLLFFFFCWRLHQSRPTKNFRGSFGPPTPVGVFFFWQQPPSGFLSNFLGLGPGAQHDSHLEMGVMESVPRFFPPGGRLFVVSGFCGRGPPCLGGGGGVFFFLGVSPPLLSFLEKRAPAHRYRRGVPNPPKPWPPFFKTNTGVFGGGGCPPFFIGYPAPRTVWALGPPPGLTSFLFFCELMTWGPLHPGPTQKKWGVVLAEPGGAPAYHGCFFAPRGWALPFPSGVINFSHFARGRQMLRQKKFSFFCPWEATGVVVDLEGDTVGEPKSKRRFVQAVLKKQKKTTTIKPHKLSGAHISDWTWELGETRPPLGEFTPRWGGGGHHQGGAVGVFLTGWGWARFFRKFLTLGPPGDPTLLFFANRVGESLVGGTFFFFGWFFLVNTGGGRWGVPGGLLY